MSGFIKLHRNLKEWEWYEDHNATRLLVHLLVSVNYEDKKWRGIVIKKGSFVCSWETLSNGCGLSIQQCRTNVKKLIACGEVTRKVTNKYQVLTLVKWDKMQIKEVKATSKPTNTPTIKQQTNNKQITTTKEREEREEYKETNIKEREERKRFSPPSVEDVDSYFLEKGLEFELSKKEAQKYIDYYTSNGWKVGRNKMSNWKSAASGWVNRLDNFKKEKSSDKKEKRDAMEILMEKHKIHANS